MATNKRCESRFFRDKNNASGLKYRTPKTRRWISRDSRKGIRIDRECRGNEQTVSCYETNVDEESIKSGLSSRHASGFPRDVYH